LRNAGSTIRRPRPRSASTDNNVNSVNKLILSQKGAFKSNRTIIRQTLRQSKIYDFGITCRSSEFEVEMLEEASCARVRLLQTMRCTELAHKNCNVVSQHPLWTSYF